MIGQSKLHSALEANVNLVAAYPVTFAIYAYVLPYFGYHFSKSQSVGFTVIFSVASLARQYALRRLFDWFYRKYHSVV